MKKTLKLLLVSLSTLLLSTGCSAVYTVTTSNNNKTSTTTSSSESSTSSSSETVLGEYAGQTISLSMLNTSSSITTVPSTGDSKIVVIPVYFSDYTCEDLGLDEDEVKTNLYNAFFGESDDTGWESVSSYYYKSSYEQLNITGMVTDLCPIGQTLSEIAALTSSSSYYDPTYTILETANEFFKTNYSSSVSEYDTDNDGYIDGIWLVYLNPYLSSSSNLDYYIEKEGWSTSSLSRSNSSDYQDYSNISDILWAYTYWDYYSTSSVTSPNAKAYCWASYSFLFEGGYEGVDAHTFIHETGHLLGLDDYYSYDYSDAPIGGLAMMDNNIGDHDAFSKYLLNWISPKIVKESGEYTISKFTETGDTLLIPATLSTYNDSPYSEYLLIEYYTPDGLNELDATNAYASGAQMFTEAGVLIYHVDSRLMKVQATTTTSSRPNGGTTTKYTYSFTDTYEYPTSTSYVTVASSNTESYSYTSGRLLTLISSEHPDGKYTTTSKMSGITTTKAYYYQDRENYWANDSDLFLEGDSITSFNFNNGDSLDYSITITSISNDSVTISIK
jgi:M6 family metalloprotease-like protein